jgi:glycosyltransferase involved in cell wall biosynthesis
MNPGGAEYQAYLLACGLKERYEVCYLFSHGNRKQRLSEDGFTLYQIPRHFWARRLLGRVFALDYSTVTGLLKHISPDVIYNRGANAYTGIAASYARRAGCRMIWHIAHEHDIQPAWLRSVHTAAFDYVDKKWTEYGIRSADTVIGQAKYQDKLLRRNYRRSCDLIVGNFHPVPSEQVVKTGPTTVVWVANLKPFKQPQVFLRLVGEMRDYDHVRFVMIGRPASGSYQRRLEREMMGLKNFNYMGERPIEEVNRILASSHVFVNTSQYEGFPNTFVQAWFRRVPVVSLNVDPDDVLKTSGLGFHSVSFEGLVRDVKRLIEDGALRESMGRQAQKYALDHHSMGPNIAKIMSLLEKTGQTGFYG